MDQKGYTLVELVVGMAIMTIIMTGILGVLGVSVTSYHYAQKRTYEVQQARIAVNELISDLQKATTITEPAKGATSSRAVYAIGSDNYTVEMGTGANAGCIVRNGNRITANIVKDITFARDSSDGRMMTVTVVLNNPENNSTGEFMLSTKVFSPNLTR